MEQLPEDMLADVLGRLPPSSLAASRCVRKRWRSLIDARRLLPTADLLPLRLDAFYLISLSIEIDLMTYLFARPAAARRIPGGCLEFLDEEYSYLLEVEDSCNGLLLVLGMVGGRMVANPATRQWASLPDSPKPPTISDMLGVRVLAGTATAGDQDQDRKNDEHRLLNWNYYLVYDPMAESPQHFEVFRVQLSLCRYLWDRVDITIDLEEQEWPPSTFRALVFSSRRWRWEERSWIRQGEPAGTMADMLQSNCNCYDHKAVYFRGALYVHFQNDSVIRICLSNDKYQVVRSPEPQSKLGSARSGAFYLGKSEKGVYFASWVGSKFEVWLLKEQEENDEGHHHIHMEWVLKTSISLTRLPEKPFLLLADDDWRVIRKYNDEELPPAAAHGDHEFVAGNEWDFDNADIVLDDTKDNTAGQAVVFLGFHPYKEIVFFSLSSTTISYNLNTSKVQQLGGMAHIPVGIRTCFPYTPCFLTMGELFENS